MSEVSDVAALEQHQDNCRKLVERRQMALRLFENADFKKLILEEFCVQDAARYVQLSADPAMGANERADALALAQASGHLKRYLSMTVQMGYTATRDLPDIEQALAEARGEEGAL